MSHDLALGVACHVLFGAPRALDCGREDPAELIAVLRAHRVPVAVLPMASGLEAEDATLAAYVSDQRKRHARGLLACQEVAEAWAASGIEAVLIKSPAYFPYTSSNVDVLIAGGRAAEAYGVLERLGYRELRGTREPYKRLFRRLRPPHLGFPVHVHTAVAWINRFLTDVEVLAGRRHNEELQPLAYPSPDNVFLVTTAHWLYEDKELTLRDLYHASLAVRDGVNWAAVRWQAERTGWRDGLELALSVYRAAAERFDAPDFAARLPSASRRRAIFRREPARPAMASSAPIRLSKPLCKGLQVAKTVRDPQLSKAARASELLSLVSFAFRAQLPSGRHGPFLVVSLSGPDGAGKTTLAHALQDFLLSEPGVVASYHWSRLGSSTALEVVRGLARTFRSAVGDGIDEGSRDLQRPRLLRAWGYVLAADVLVRLWVRFIHCRMTAGMHIFDRDAVDAAADLESMYGLRDARWVTALAPSPTVQIVLRHVRSGGSDGASPDHVVGDLRALTVYARYEEIADVVLPAREALDSLVTEAAGAVFRSYAGRPVTARARRRGGAIGVA